MVNSIVPVKKPDGSLRLCLDPKDLRYSRIVDDVYPSGTSRFEVLQLA